MFKAAILRLLRFTTKYDIKLKKNESVTLRTMEINFHPSDYERDEGHSLQVSVFDTLSKTHLVMDTSGNISAFLAMWKKEGLRAAVESVKLKYELFEAPSDKVLLKRIDEGVAQLLQHSSVDAPRANVGPKVGKKAREEGESGGTAGEEVEKKAREEGEGVEGNGNGNGVKGNGNGNGGGGDD